MKEIRDEVTTFDTDPTLNPEGLKLAESADEAIAAKGFGAKPLVVLASADTTASRRASSRRSARSSVDVWWRLQEELADLSTAGRLEKVTGATHEIIFERPDAVADAIREVLGS